jgi:hypothetical protein
MNNIFELPFDDYMNSCYNHAIESGFFRLFPEIECLAFAQALWARRYWMYKNGSYEI